MNTSNSHRNPPSCRAATTVEHGGFSARLKLPSLFTCDVPRRRCRHDWIILLLTFVFSFRLLAEVPAPGGGGTNSYPWLDSWSFRDTNYWTTDLGYYPSSYSGISLSPLGPGDSLDVDSTNASWLVYPVNNYDGTTNLNVVSDGSAMFWFAPNWASTSDTNDLGAGPGVFGRLLEIGEYTTNASIGWWSLYMDDVGNTLYFTAQDEFGDQTNYLSAPVTFTSNVWHLVVLTWTSANTALFVDGICLTNGPGISVLPNSSVIGNGFAIGSDAATGVMQMHGAINGLTTYNSPIQNTPPVFRTFMMS